MKLRATLVAATASFFATAAAGGLTEDDAAVPVTEVPLLEAAAAPYVLLRADIASMEASGIKSAASIRDAHNRLASHDPDMMAKAFVSYAALVAADSPVFAAEIEKRTNRNKKREEFLAELRNNPAMVRDMPGANEAIAAVMTMSARDATRINALGELYIDRAYSMQQVGWARQKLGTKGMDRVRGAAVWAEARAWPEMPARPAIQSKAGTVRPNLVADEAWTPEWSPTPASAVPDSKSGAMMTRALVLAARYSTNDLNEGQLNGFAISKPTDRCFVTAKLNLDQCIAATRTPYEEAFCIGTHGLNDISQCVGWPSGAGAPDEG